MATHSFKQVTGGKTKYKRDNGGYSTIIEADVTSEGNIVTVTGKNDNIYINLVVDIVETITADGTVTTYNPGDITGDALGDILNVLFNTEGSGSNAYVADYTGDYGDYSGLPAITGLGSYLGELTGTEQTTTPAVAGDVFIFALAFQLVPTSGGVIDDTQLGKLNAGRWTETLEATFFNNSVTVYNNRHYVVIDSTELNGTAPNVNTAAYLLLPLSSTTGYIPVLT